LDCGHCTHQHLRYLLLRRRAPPPDPHRGCDRDDPEPAEAAVDAEPQPLGARRREGAPRGARRRDHEHRRYKHADERNKQRAQRRVAVEGIRHHGEVARPDQQRDAPQVPRQQGVVPAGRGEGGGF
jgi:hypothetical protein